MPWVPESRLSMFNYVPVFNNQTSNGSALEERVSFTQIFISQDSRLMASKDQGLLEGTVDIKHRDDSKHGFLPDLTLSQVLLLVWLSGVIGVGLFVVFKNLGFWIVVRKKSPVIDQGVLDQLEACKRQMKIQTEVNLVLTDKVKSPALFGYIHPRLLLPEEILERLDKDNLHYVFLHELAHLKRHDIAISWLVTVLQAVHWFNPFVWFAFYQMRIDQEIACDAYVLSQVERHQSMRYADTLVGLLECFLENRNVPALAGILESKSRIRRRIITIVQNRQYSKTLTLSAVSLFLVIGFTFFTTAKGTSTETPNANEQQEIIASQPIATDTVSLEAMKSDDSGASKDERVMQETEDQTRVEISASSSKKMATNELLTQPNEVTPKVEEQLTLTEEKPIVENEFTGRRKDDKPEVAQPTENKQQAEEQIQTVITMNTQSVSTEESFVSNEQQAVVQKDTIHADEKSAPLKTNDLIPEQKSDMVQKAKIEDKGAKISKNTESILDGTRLLTSAEPPDSSIGMTHAYPAILFRNHIDEPITTTSLLHYLEGSGHPTLFSHEVEESIEEAGTSSAVQEDPSHLGVGEEPSGKKASSSIRIDEPPKVLSEGEVKYPFRAKRLGLTGKVSVSFWVNTDGQATNIKAVKAEPENALVTFAGAAEEVIANSRFKPGISAGEPVPVKVRKEIRFEIL
jgi:bla regulator protein BlaR1